MSNPDDFDALLQERFDREHRQVPAAPFVTTAMRRIRTDRRRTAVIRNALRVAALLAASIASPWLIAGATRLNAALESSLAWTTGLPGAWVLGALAAATLLAMQVRNR